MADPRVLDELERRLSEATGPDSAVDAWIAAILSVPGWVLAETDYTQGRKYPVRCGDGFAALPPYTASLDSALALVEEKLPGWGWSCQHRYDGGQPERLFTANVFDNLELSRSKILSTALGATPSIALCLVLIRALREKADG